MGVRLMDPNCPSPQRPKAERRASRPPDKGGEVDRSLRNYVHHQVVAQRLFAIFFLFPYSLLCPMRSFGWLSPTD